MHLRTVITVTLLLITALWAAAPHTASAQDLPDLLIQEIRIDPPHPRAGENADITVIVANKGSATSPGFRVYLYVAPEDDPPTLQTPFTAQTFVGIGLAPNTTFEYVRTNQPFSEAGVKVYAWVDRDNEVEESNESNNVLMVDTTLPPIPPDNFEPDDDCTDAQEIPLDEVQTRNLAMQNNKPDQDWILIRGEANVKYRIVAEAIGQDADLILELRNQCAGMPNLGSGATLEFTAPTNGEYLVRVSHRQESYGADTTYRLLVKASGGCRDDREYNDLCTFAVDYSVGSGPQTHLFCEPNDVDWIKFPVKAGATYNITVQNLGSQANTQMALLNACEGEVIATGPSISHTSPRSGELFIRTSHAQPQTTGPETQYSVTVALNGPDGCIEDDFENDNQRTSAGQLNIDGPPRQYNICPAGDEDWTRFTTQSGITYTIETLNLGPESDTLLCIYDSTGKELACDDDGGSGKASRLIWQAPAEGEYFVRVRDVKADKAGDLLRYSIRLSSKLCQTGTGGENTTRNKALALTVGATPQTHSVCPAGTDGWYRFGAAANTPYVIETRSLGPAADTVIELYDTAGNLLARNDDFSPGIASQIVFTPTAAGDFFVRVRLFDPTAYGAGTEYTIGVKTGQPKPVVQPTPMPEPGPRAETAKTTGIQTLIVVNPSRLAALYPSDEVDQLMEKLTLLAQQPNVVGEIVRIDDNGDVSAAYAHWLGDIVSADRANQVAAAIRQLIMNYVRERESVKYIVLVGDDRVIPFRRVPDPVIAVPNSKYPHVTTDHPTGAALKNNYILTDDYYASTKPIVRDGRSLYLPDYAIGRLIETPADMIAFIEHFINSPATQVDNVLVTGWDFVDDSAEAECTKWQSVLGNPAVNCLIGQRWTKGDMTQRQFQKNPVFKVQTIHGHGEHFAEILPGNVRLTAAEIASQNLDWSGGLVYSVACHAGLNVPPTNGNTGTDLPEVFVRAGANYIGNTGFGYGVEGGIAFTEALIVRFNEQLTSSNQVYIGEAFRRAKQEYFEKTPNFQPVDEKVVQQMIFYGLPMTRLLLPGTFSTPDDPFPGVGFEVSPPTLVSTAGALAGNDLLVTGTVQLNFAAVLNDSSAVQRVSTDEGEYFSLYGSTHTAVGGPPQPLHFGDVSNESLSVASVRLRSAQYRKVEEFNPALAVPYNEYTTEEEIAQWQASVQESTGWYPPSPLTVQTLGDRAMLTTQMGQYNYEDGTLRLLEGADAEIYYTTSDGDKTPPTISVVGAVIYQGDNQVRIKVGVSDTVGVHAVYILYSTDPDANPAVYKTLPLRFNAVSHKWEGSYVGTTASHFLVQAVDLAGNLIEDTNKGRFFYPVADSSASPYSSCGGSCLFIPRLNR